MWKNILKVLISNFVLVLVGIINSFLLPIILSIEQFAHYQEYLLYISYANICHLGIASGMFLNYAGKNYSNIDKSEYKSEIYLIYFVLSIFSIIGLCYVGISKSILLLCVTLTIFPMCIIVSFQSLYQAWERFTNYSIINALPKILFTLIVLLQYFIFRRITSNHIILVYLIIQWVICLYCIAEFTKFTKGIKSKPLFSRKNLKTCFDGFLIMFGNYINLLFHCIDKQFVNIFYSTLSFSIYSFAMSMQNIMTIFIMAIASPFYPRLAKDDISKEFISNLKELLLMFGAYSGCAYFAVTFFINHFVSKYSASQDVVFVFFAVFPAMAIINVLYINLYRIKRLLKKYIITLSIMLTLSAFFNSISILLRGDYIGISIATLISYYVWLIYSQKDFELISITKKDYFYLFGYFIIYSLCKFVTNEIIGCISYSIIISVWNYLLYQKTIKMFINFYITKINKHC